MTERLRHLDVYTQDISEKGISIILDNTAQGLQQVDAAGNLMYNNAVLEDKILLDNLSLQEFTPYDKWQVILYVCSITENRYSMDEKHHQGVVKIWKVFG